MATSALYRRSLRALPNFRSQRERHESATKWNGGITKQLNHAGHMRDCSKSVLAYFRPCHDLTTCTAGQESNSSFSLLSTLQEHGREVANFPLKVCSITFIVVPGRLCVGRGSCYPLNVMTSPSKHALGGTVVSKQM
ncbi:hypothetical protein Bbelb_130350 [Branchiostoma belcheri]|nr:hypothetical protein Bbelb_130350 [Branchiostoma belcheri]